GEIVDKKEEPITSIKMNDAPTKETSDQKKQVAKKETPAKQAAPTKKDPAEKNAESKPAKQAKPKNISEKKANKIALATIQGEIKKQVAKKETPAKQSAPAKKPPAEKKAESKPAKQEKPKNSSEKKAIQIALDTVKGEVDDVDLERSNGQLYYFIEVETAEDTEAEIQIHAITGEVISIEWDD